MGRHAPHHPPPNDEPPNNEPPNHPRPNLPAPRGLYAREPATRAMLALAILTSAAVLLAAWLLPSPPRPLVRPWTEAAIAESRRRADVIASRVLDYRATYAEWPADLRPMQAGVGPPLAGDTRWVYVIDSPRRARLGFYDPHPTGLFYEIQGCEKTLEWTSEGPSSEWRRW